MTSPSMRPSRRTLLASAATAALATPLLKPAGADAAPAARPGSGPSPLGRSGRADLRRWATATWRSLVAMTDPGTGLASDQIPSSLTGRVRQTSPTNIGGYLWSAVVARDLGIITAGECNRRVRQTLTTLQRMERHQPSGMFYNWYDVTDGSVLRTWPGSTNPVVPFVSSVDNAWLGAALHLVQSAVPAVHHLADALFGAMRWDMFYDTRSSVFPAPLIHGGFYTTDPGSANTAVFTGNHIGVGADVWYTNHHYDTCVSETRMTNYLGIATGQIPGQSYYHLWRTFNPDWTWQEMTPVGQKRTYLGYEVFEGAYTYRGMHIVPGWGGSMFEELMPDMFVDEATWAPHSWGVNHPLHVRAQREHGLDDAKYGYWGFSPSMDPYGGYREFGVDALGLNPTGYYSDEEKTEYDVGYPSDPGRPAKNPPTSYGDGIVTPHASFLAMMHEPEAALDNLRRIERQLGGVSHGGFLDALATRSPRKAEVHLSLDQSMVMGAIGNVLGDGIVRHHFSPGIVERNVRPVIAPEVFSAGIA